MGEDGVEGNGALGTVSVSGLYRYGHRTRGYNRNCQWGWYIITNDNSSNYEESIGPGHTDVGRPREHHIGDNCRVYAIPLGTKFTYWDGWLYRRHQTRTKRKAGWEQAVVDTRRRGDCICGLHETCSNAGRWRALVYEADMMSIPVDGMMEGCGQLGIVGWSELLRRSRNRTNRTLGDEKSTGKLFGPTQGP